MDRDFWLNKWQNNDINFHENEVNPLLIKHAEQLLLTSSDRIFLPLCGKTLDISWLISKGFRVAGVELYPGAINQLFKGLGIEPTLLQSGQLTCYSADNIDIFSGDIFDLTAEQLGPVNAIYDRAALVALPSEIRSKYTSHLLNITRSAPQLLISYEYDQNLVAGPPFSVTQQEIENYYSNNYQITLLDSVHIVGGLKGKYDATECVWLLNN